MTMIFLLLSLLGLVPTFQKSKCKKLLKTTMKRISLLSSRRDAQLRQLRNDLVKLLQLGKQQKAQVWLGRIGKELQLRSVYIKISAYCQRVQVNLTDIAGHSDCPENLQEPLAGLCFAASCCADLPELQELREIFTMKYGKEFVASALELGRECLVNEEAVEEIAADDELKDRIEQALRQQQEHEMKVMMDAQNSNEFSLPHCEEGCDFESENHTSKEHRNGLEGDNTAIVQCNDGRNQGLTLCVRQPQLSLPPQRAPPPPGSTQPLPLPRRSASTPSFSHYVRNETTSPSLSPPWRCPEDEYRGNSKVGILVHPRLPKYEDLVASFTALKH